MYIHLVKYRDEKAQKERIAYKIVDGFSAMRA